MNCLIDDKREKTSVKMGHMELEFQDLLER